MKQVYNMFQNDSYDMLRRLWLCCIIPIIPLLHDVFSILVFSIIFDQWGLRHELDSYQLCIISYSQGIK